MAKTKAGGGLKYTVRKGAKNGAESKVTKRGGKL